MSDAASLAENANEGRVWMSLRDRFPRPYNLEHARAFLLRTFADLPETNFAVTVDDLAVGGIGFELQSDVERVSSEIGAASVSVLEARLRRSAIKDGRIQDQMFYAFGVPE